MNSSQTTGVLRNCIVGLLFIIPIVPLIIAGSLYFPYITGKAFAFRIIVEIAVALYLILILRDRSYLPKKSPLLWSMIGFVVILGLATIFSIEPARSFWSDYERMEGYITILHLFAYFIILAGTFSRKAWFWFTHTSLIVSIIVGLYGFAHKAERIAGTLGNSTYLGVYALLHMFMAGYFMVRVFEKKARKDAWPWAVGYLILIAFNAAVLYKTGTRGSFVGLIIGAAVTAIMLAIFERRRKIVRYSAVGLIALMIIVVGGLGLLRNTSFVTGSPLLSRFSALITTNVGSVIATEGYARTLIWGMAFEGFKDRPILGWGQDNFNYVFAKHYDPRMYSQEQWFDRSHNVFFDWLIAGGLLGLLGYLSLFVALLYLIWRKQKQGDNIPHLQEPWSFTEKTVFTGMIIAYFIHNLFVFDNLVSYLIFFALLAYIHHRSTTHENEHHHHTPLIADSGYQIGTMIVAVVVVLFIMYTAVIKPYIEATYLIDALNAHQGGVDTKGNKVGGNDAVSLAYYQKAFAENTFGNSEVRERLSETAANAITSTLGTSTTDRTVAQGFAALTKDQFEKQFLQTPQDPRYFLFYGLYLSNLNDLDDALVYFQKALDLSPNKQSFLFQVGLMYFEKQNYDKSVEYMKKAYEEDNSYGEALSLYATTLVYDKKADIAQKELSAADARGLIVNTDARILQAYLDTKQFTALEDMIKEQIAATPTNGQLHVSLAAVYLKAGDRYNAVKEIQAAIAIEPAFKDQGNYYIKEIQAGRDPSQQSAAQ